jgi:hypothetical protein
MIKEFLREMYRFVPRDSRILCSQFRGDPEEDFKGKWRARVLKQDWQIDQSANVYVCVSAMRKNSRGEYRRRKENFAGGVLLMIDDIGTGGGAKFGFDIIDPLTPTALVETSKDNFQAVYFFDSLVESLNEFDALIRAFIDAQFLGQDTGMAGVNRVFRPPAGINGKPKHGGWKVRCEAWNPELRYSVKEICDAFGLALKKDGPRMPKGATANKAANIRAFIETRSVLRSAGMLKKEDADLAGWTDVICPWVHEHTGAKDNGSAIRIPDEDNSWFGAFKCFHGSCSERGWSELTEFVSDHAEIILDEINKNHKRYLKQKHERS